MTATYDFYSCYQKPGQPFTEWKAELCEKLRYCGFTKSALKKKPQDRALRDMYVIGVNNPKIRQALLKEQDPDLESAEKIIQLAERLQEDVRHFAAPSSHVDNTVAKVQPNKRNRRSRSPNKSALNVANKPCQTCGLTGHPRSKCKYRDFTCNFCKRSGHLERACRQKKEKKPTNRIQSSQLNHVNQCNQLTSSSTTISLRVNGRNCAFELDTGADNTIITIKDWKKLGSPTLRPSTLQLKCYSGKPLRIKGTCNVNVNYENKSFNLTMIVVHGAGSPLVGLQWITAMKIDMNQLIHGNNHVQRPICKIYSQVKLQSMLCRYNTVFDKRLGHCTKVQARIQLKPNPIPKFFKPRSIAFAYLDGVKEEIQRNVDAGILQPIDTSAWAAPIVPIRKPTGKIRICGDFKVTINPHILVDQINILFHRSMNFSHV